MWYNIRFRYVLHSGLTTQDKNTVQPIVPARSDIRVESVSDHNGRFPGSTCALE